VQVDSAMRLSADGARKRAQGSRSPGQIDLSPPAKRRGGAAFPWTAAEIAILRSMVMRDGLGGWDIKAQTFADKQRTSKSLEAAYYKYVAPEVRRMRLEGREPGELSPDAPELQ
jgi:hypothetical protein